MPIVRVRMYLPHQETRRECTHICMQMALNTHTTVRQLTTALRSTSSNVTENRTLAPEGMEHILAIDYRLLDFVPSADASLHYLLEYRSTDMYRLASPRPLRVNL